MCWPRKDIYLFILIPIVSLAVMEPKVSNKENDKDVQDSKTEKQKGHWTISNKKLFIDLAIEQRHLGNRPGNLFTALGWENIPKAFNKGTGFCTNFHSSRTYTNNSRLVGKHKIVLSRI